MLPCAAQPLRQRLQTNGYDATLHLILQLPRGLIQLANPGNRQALILQMQALFQLVQNNSAMSQELPLKKTAQPAL